MAPASDPLSKGTEDIANTFGNALGDSFGNLVNSSDTDSDVTSLEVVRLPASSLSPELRPAPRSSGNILKEATCRQVLERLKGCVAGELPGKCRRSTFPIQSCTASVVVESGAAQGCVDDGYGLEPALLVVPCWSSDDVALLATVTRFLRSGPGVRAVFAPEVVAMRLQGDAGIVPGQRFKPGSDLFRIVEPGPPVAAGAHLRKADKTTVAFAVLVLPGKVQGKLWSVRQAPERPVAKKPVGVT